MTDSPVREGRGLLVRLAEQALQAQEHAPHVVHSAPFILEDIEADASREIHVGVVNRSFEQHSRRRVGIRGWEHERELERQRRVRGLSGSGNRGCPCQQVRWRVGERGYPWRGVDHELHQFILETGVSRWGSVGFLLMRAKG